MKHGGKVLIGLAGGLMLGQPLFGLTPEGGNPYATIADRNVFALKAIPPPPPPPDPNVTPPQKIVLLGIVTVFGKQEVLYRTMASAKLGEAPKEMTFSTAVGGRDGEVEILEVDRAAGSVKVKNHGVEQTLTLEKDGMKPAGTAPPVGVPAIPGIVPVPAPGGGVPGVPGVPTAGAIPMPMPTPTTAGGVTTFGGAATLKRELRVTPTTAAGYSAASGTSAGGVVMPGAGTSPNHMRNWPPENTALTPDEQALSHIIQNTANKAAIERGEMPPLPAPPLPTK